MRYGPRGCRNAPSSGSSAAPGPARTTPPRWGSVGSAGGFPAAMGLPGGSSRRRRLSSRPRWPRGWAAAAAASVGAARRRRGGESRCRAHLRRRPRRASPARKAARVHAHARVLESVRVRVHVHVHVCMCMCMCTCMLHVHVHVHVHACARSPHLARRGGRRLA